ncbi:S1 family peptidase [Aggregatimonas sangjinii]|uniref:S1 family peptidase n=1 Tax=Aggregatimonas sangjinii TaxID=2583587 RepID=A0A5B7SSX0_9FLAO|nr:trypsin-like serine protease [Aggregatimonas sangjinii]QCW99939.1 S1 family peptidase [Aggregatimonas sangjinii]
MKTLMTTKKLIWSILIMVCIPYCTFSQEDDIGSTSSELRQGAADVNTPTANATVKVGTCTGTLIANNIVLTSGHCFDEDLRQVQGSRTAYPHGCNDWENPTQWYPFNGGVTIPVRIGNDSENWEATYQANAYSLPGCVDIIMLRLANPVPRSVAIPATVATQLTVSSLQDQQLQMVGWGSSGLEDLWKKSTVNTNVNAGWDLIGHANLVTGMAESEGNLFAATEGNTLWMRPASGANVRWQKIGHANNVIAMAALDGKLFAATSDDKLWVRDAVPINVNWQSIGHANGITAMTAIDNELYATTNSNRLVVREPVLEDAPWANIGHANDIIALASSNGRIYGAQATNTMWSRPTGRRDLDWRYEGEANDIRAMAATDTEIFATNRPGDGFPQNSRRLRQTGLATFGGFLCGTGSAASRRAQFCANGIGGARILPGDSGGPIYWLRPGLPRVLIGVTRQTNSVGGTFVATFFNRTATGVDTMNIGRWISRMANPQTP